MRAIATLMIFVAALLAAPMAAEGAAPAAGAPSAGVQVTLFWAEGCPHCQRAIRFLRALEQEDPRISVRYLEISADEFNREAFFAVANKMGADRVSVPFAVIGERLIIGYVDATTTGAELRAQARECLERSCPERNTCAPRGVSPTCLCRSAMKRCSPASRPRWTRIGLTPA
jgi:glutaredoxin